MSSALVRPTPSRLAHVKGTGLFALFDWYVSEHGRASLVRLLTDLSPADRGRFDLHDERWGVLASEWYPAPLAHELLERMTAGLDDEARAGAAWRMGQRAAETTLTGIYRLLFQAMLTPERYARHAQTLFSRYFDDGRIVKEPRGPRRHHTTIRDWGGHHPLLCSLFLSSSVYVYTALGCRHVTSRRLSCVVSGAEECAYDITWDAG
jgi:hypothetical protein